MFNDPLKLLPLLGYGAILAMIYLGKLSTNDGLALLGAMGLLHSGISTVNNRNPKE